MPPEPAQPVDLEQTTRQSKLANITVLWSGSAFILDDSPQDMLHDGDPDFSGCWDALGPPQLRIQVRRLVQYFHNKM